MGIVDPTLNAPCIDADGNPVVSPPITSVGQCAANSYGINLNYNPLLTPYDLTRPTAATALFLFRGRTDVKELALYIQDAITAGNWAFNVGIRGDIYNGLTVARQAEPRVGLSYHVKPSSTVLRASYARTLETPFNENLILSSEGCGYAVIQGLVPCVTASLPPGYRNEFHAGLQQAFGRHLVVGGEYIWKYTHNSFDFSVLGNTPITFPIDWHNSKIPGFALNATVPAFHGFSAELVMSSVAARFFSPQVGGLGTVPATTAGQAFRIDHDERFNQTTHVQYQFARRGLLSGAWAGWSWRNDSGQVAGAMPFAANAATPVDLSGLSYDQQFAVRHRLQRRAGDSHLRLPVLPAFAVHILADLDSSAGHGKRRSQPAAHRPAQPLRRLGRARQHLPQGALQSEPEPDRRECHRQVRAL